MHERCERLSRLPALPWLLTCLVLLAAAWARPVAAQAAVRTAEPAVVLPRVQVQPQPQAQAQVQTPVQTPAKPNPDPRHVIVPPRTFTVPSVSGMSLAAAQRKITGAGFQSRLAPGQYDASAETVERTEPDAGQIYTADQRPVVQIVLAASPRKMPSIIGMTCDQARRRLESERIQLVQCSVGTYSGRTSANTIHTQQPAAGTTIAPNLRQATAVVEPDTVEVPEVRGQALNQAVQRLEQSRLHARPSLPPQAAQRVLAQQPNGGDRVAPRSEVKLTLGYAVPALTGLECDEARRRVLAAGHRSLDCRTETTPSALGQPGRIFRQQPAAGTSVEPLAMQAFTPLLRVRVPALVDKPEEAAVSALRQVRLIPRVEGPAAAAGRVVAAQSPAPQTLVGPGSTVEITLALSVPDMRGASCDAARALSQRHGFAAFECRRRVAAPSVALGRVFVQEPAARTLLTATRPIEATVAQGILVPKVTGLDLPDALERVSAAGLSGHSDASGGERVVVAQRPPANSEVQPGAAVALTTQRMTEVPALVGRTLQEALPLIDARELRARPDSADEPALRRVQAQQPPAGTRAAVGTAVGLKTLLETIVPEVTGRSLDEARASVDRARLHAQVETSSRVGAKTVRRQQPAAGERVAVGSAVTLHAITRVEVPEVRRIGCEEAQAAMRNAGLVAGPCRVEGWLGVRLGTPTVERQSVAPGSLVDEDSVLVLEARTPLAPVVALGSTLTALLSAGFFWWRRAPPAPGVAAPPALSVRIEPDLAPRVDLRAPQDMAAAEDGTPDAHDEESRRRAFERALKLRIEGAEARTSIRAWHENDRYEEPRP